MRNKNQKPYSLILDERILSLYWSCRPCLCAMKFFKRIFRKTKINDLRIDIINIKTQQRYSYLCSATKLEKPTYYYINTTKCFKREYRFTSRRIF